MILFLTTLQCKINKKINEFLNFAFLFSLEAKNSYSEENITKIKLDLEKELNIISDIEAKVLKKKRKLNGENEPSTSTSVLNSFYDSKKKI